MENIRYTTSLLTNMFIHTNSKGDIYDSSTGSKVSDDFVQFYCFDTNNLIAMNSVNPSIDKNFNIQRNTIGMFTSLGQIKYNIEILNNIRLSDFELIDFKQNQLQIAIRYYDNAFMPF